MNAITKSVCSIPSGLCLLFLSTPGWTANVTLDFNSLPSAQGWTFTSNGPIEFFRFVQEQTCVPPPSGLVSWWDGDGDAQDLVSTNDGTLNGVTFAQGKVGQAFDFDEEGDAVLVPGESGDFFDTVPMAGTIDMWFKPRDTIASGSSEMTLFDKLNAGGNRIIGFFMPSDGRLRFRMRNNSSHDVVSDRTMWEANRWFHVAFTWDSTAGMKMYIDGTLQASTRQALYPIPGGLRDFTIGANNASGDPFLSFDGLIDEFEVFNRALSQEEIQAIVAAGSAGKCKEPKSVNLSQPAWSAGGRGMGMPRSS